MKMKEKMSLIGRGDMTRGDVFVLFLMFAYLMIMSSILYMFYLIAKEQNEIMKIQDRIIKSLAVKENE